MSEPSLPAFFQPPRALPAAAFLILTYFSLDRMQPIPYYAGNDMMAPICTKSLSLLLLATLEVRHGI